MLTFGDTAVEQIIEFKRRRGRINLGRALSHDEHPNLGGAGAAVTERR